MLDFGSTKLLQLKQEKSKTVCRCLQIDDHEAKSLQKTRAEHPRDRSDQFLDMLSNQYLWKTKKWIFGIFIHLKESISKPSEMDLLIFHINLGIPVGLSISQEGVGGKGWRRHSTTFWSFPQLFGHFNNWDRKRRSIPQPMEIAFIKNTIQIANNVYFSWLEIIWMSLKTNNTVQNDTRLYKWQSLCLYAQSARVDLSYAQARKTQQLQFVSKNQPRSFPA